MNTQYRFYNQPRIHKPLKVIKPDRRAVWREWCRIANENPQFYRVGHKVTDTKIFTYLENVNPYLGSIAAVTSEVIGTQGLHAYVKHHQWHIVQYMEWVTDVQ